MMENAEVYKSYKEAMTGLVDSVRTLRELEDQMTEAAGRDDTDGLQDLVRKSQPELLRFRGLEMTRIQCEKALEIDGKAFDAILKDCTEAERNELSPIYEDLSRELKLFRESRDNADRIMKVRLMNINDYLRDVSVPEPFHETMA